MYKIQPIIDYIVDTYEFETHSLVQNKEWVSIFEKKFILSENKTDMLPFTQYLNHKYKIYNGLLWSYSAKEFFSTTKAVNFYRKVIRKLKFDLIYVN